MKNILFHILFITTLLHTSNKLVAAQTTEVNDCLILSNIFKQFNRPDLVTWNNNIDGSCCDESMSTIVCDPHNGHYRIAELKLRSKGFTGTISEDIAQLKYLNYISFADNNITGSIPTNLDQLIYLTKFSLRSNNLSGSIPATLGNLDGIFHLDLSSNNLNGQIPETFGNLKQLQFLNLGENNLDGYVPESLRGLKKLTTFQLGDNPNLNGYVPLMDTVSNCTYVNTNLCYLEGAVCQSTAHLCSEDEIKTTREYNGYSTYSEDNSNSSNSSGSSSNCNCDNNGSKGGFFSNKSLWYKILIGVAAVLVLALLAYWLFGRKSKDDTYKMKSTTGNYNGYYY